jgi:hypothetical protein
MQSRLGLLSAGTVALALLVTPTPLAATAKLGPGHRFPLAPNSSKHKSGARRAPGDQLWAARFNGISTVSVGLGNAHDYATIAYDAG